MYLVFREAEFEGPVGMRSDVYQSLDYMGMELKSCLDKIYRF